MVLPSLPAVAVMQWNLHIVCTTWPLDNAARIVPRSYDHAVPASAWKLDTACPKMGFVKNVRESVARSDILNVSEHFVILRVTLHVQYCSHQQ